VTTSVKQQGRSEDTQALSDNLVLITMLCYFLNILMAK